MRHKKLIELDDAQGRAAVTERFLARLHRSSELLLSDKAADARRLLDEAFEAQSTDPSGQATLALVYFKLGLYPRALAMYQKLAIEYPDDPVLHLNLALVLFKTGQTAEARDTLMSVVEMAPDYRKAYGYLGLAHQRLGEFEAAMEAFRIAGAHHMAERMARFVEPARETDPDSAAALADDVPSIPPPPSHPERERSRDSKLPPPSVTSPISLAAPARSTMEPLPVSELVDQTRLGEPFDGRFLINDSGYLLMSVADRIYSRLHGIHFCSSEGLSYRRLMKNGGEEMEGFAGPGPMYEIEGSGRLGFHPKDEVFSAVFLEDEVAYVREDMLFAFEPELKFKVGKMPDDIAPLVLVRGRGAVVIRSPLPLTSLEVTPDRGVLIPADGLVGWTGRLLPRKTSGDPFEEGVEIVELTGEGAVLFGLP